MGKTGAIMKKIIFILLATAFIVNAQFKEELEKPIDLKSGMFTQQPSSLFAGFINPQNFSMKHQFSMSYSAFGGNGVALGVYTNTIGYKFTEKLNVEVDASLVNSPYSTFGQGFSDQINGIYLSRAELNYQPYENFFIQVQYRNTPAGYFSPYDRYRSFWGNSFLDY